MAAAHVVIVGGVSVNDPGGHDRFPYNFINAAARRAISFKKDAHVLVFAPPYVLRFREQKEEHTSVHIPMVDECALPLPFGYCALTVSVKNPAASDYFLDVLRKSGGKNGFAVTEIQTVDQLTAALNGFSSIETLDYFGHSSKNSLFLQYSTRGFAPAIGEVTWGKTDATKVPASRFSATSVFTSFGCSQGESGGLADELRTLWGIKTIGSEGKTDFQAIGQNEALPKSQRGYYAFPAPVKSAAGSSTYPPRQPYTP